MQEDSLTEKSVKRPLGPNKIKLTELSGHSLKPSGLAL